MCYASLGETLAECTATYVFDHDGVEPPAREFIEKQLLSFKNASIEEIVLTLDELFTRKQYEELKSEADVILKVEPFYIYPRAMRLLADDCCKWASGQDVGPLEELITTHQLIELDPGYPEALLALYSWSLCTRQLKSQSYLLGELMHLAPDDQSYEADKKLVDKQLALAASKEQRRRRLKKNDATTGGTSDARIFKANLVQVRSANRKNARPVPEGTLSTRY